MQPRKYQKIKTFERAEALFRKASKSGKIYSNILQDDNLTEEEYKLIFEAIMAEPVKNKNGYSVDYTKGSFLELITHPLFDEYYFARLIKNPKPFAYHWNPPTTNIKDLIYFHYDLCVKYKDQCADPIQMNQTLTSFKTKKWTNSFRRQSELRQDFFDALKVIERSKDDANLILSNNPQMRAVGKAIL